MEPHSTEEEVTTKKAKTSPLYTSKKDEAAKHAFLKQHGKDSDGAYRVRGRIDGGKNNK